MGNYIVGIVWYKGNGTVGRRTDLNLRNVTITDLQSARKAIEYQFEERDGFEFHGEFNRDSYYIANLCKVDDNPAHLNQPSNKEQER